MTVHTFTAYIEYDHETKLYVGTIPSLPGAHSQGATLDELQRNLEEVVALCLEEKVASKEVIEDEAFVGIQKIVVSA
jgi:predicted RNase H-like HicB family nuclease